MCRQEPQFDEYGMTQWWWLARHKENLVLGKNTEIGNFTVLGCDYGIEIQDNVKIGYNCTIMTHSSIDNRQGSVVLKKNCKIGANSVVMPGITIGENSIVGACSFVNQSIPDSQIWYGVPARFVRNVDE